MLYLLTASIQTGKTRWLASVIDALEKRGRNVYGVIAPGDWRSREEGGFEKFGIFNELLPDHERLLFAMRADLAGDGSELPSGMRANFEKRQAAQRSGKDVRDLPPEMVAILAKKAEAAKGAKGDVQSSDKERGGTQGAGAETAVKPTKFPGWLFDDEVLAQVNAHFKRLAESSAADSSARAVDDGTESGPGLLVVDELGWMELLKGEGLTEAMALLEKGPGPLWSDALIVVREDLLSYARGRFEAAWGGLRLISPSDETKAAILGA